MIISKKNAEVLVKVGAARMLLQREFTPDAFKEQVEEFKSHPEIIDEMAKKIKSFHIPEAADKIAKYLLEAVDKKVIRELNG